MQLALGDVRVLCGFLGGFLILLEVGYGDRREVEVVTAEGSLQSVEDGKKCRRHDSERFLCSGKFVSMEWLAQAVFVSWQILVHRVVGNDVGSPRSNSGGKVEQPFYQRKLVEIAKHGLPYLWLYQSVYINGLFTGKLSVLRHEQVLLRAQLQSRTRDSITVSSRRVWHYGIYSLSTRITCSSIKSHILNFSHTSCLHSLDSHFI